MQKDLKVIKKIEQENQKLKLDQMKKDALETRDDKLYIYCIFYYHYSMLRPIKIHSI